MVDGPIGAAAFNNEFGRPGLGGFFRVYEQTVDGVRRGFHKPIMSAGGLGTISADMTEKILFPAGTLLVQIGGPGMRIGMGGGAASSMAAGANAAELDFDSVQRGNPEIERRAQEVVNHCWGLGDDNPVLAIHDVGAGGLSNAFPELVDGAGLGARFDLSAVPLEETRARAEGGVVQRVAGALRRRARARVAAAVRRAVRARAVPVRRRRRRARRRPPRARRRARRPRRRGPRHRHADGGAARQAAADDARRDPGGARRRATSTSPTLDVRAAAYAVLRHPTVASKRFLVTIADRTVGGLTHRDQMVGPWQVPVADVAVTLADHVGFAGEAMATGERMPLAAVDAPASGRMAVGEALTNLLAAPLTGLAGVKLSCNWMAACGEDGEDAALYDTVEAVAMRAAPRARGLGAGRQGLALDAHAVDGRRVRRGEAGHLTGVARRHGVRVAARRAGHADAAAAGRRCRR